MKTYTFYTKTDAEGIVEHNIEAESCKKAYEILLIAGYTADCITMTSSTRALWRSELWDILRIV